MHRFPFLRLLGALVLVWTSAALIHGQPGPVPVDLTGHQPESGATVRLEASRLHLTWRSAAEQAAEIVFNLDPAPNHPLIERLAIDGVAIMQRVEPTTWLTIGERDLKLPSGWVAFFDNPPVRAYQRVAAKLTKRNVRVTSNGSRTVVRIGDVAAGSFHGVVEFTVVRNSPLVFVETVVSTEQDARAILYDAGLVSPGPVGPSLPWSDPEATTYSPLVPGPAWKTMAWLDPKGNMQRAAPNLDHVVAPLAVSRRMLVAEGAQGAVAVFPPPHQYFYPLDSANNLGFVWYGAGRSEAMNGYGFGIRQPPEGDKIWVPWVNAPPRTEQRLGVFYWLTRGRADDAIEAVSRFTHQDRFKALAGYRTFTSHYHIEHTLELTKARTDGKTTVIPPGLKQPGFVTTFKARGIDIVHLAEFHVGNMPRLSAKERLPLLKTLHEECARLSDAELLVLPGEEPNVHLGGHWLSFFPRPVYWVLNRAAGAPFVEDVPGYGKVYQVGSAADVLELMNREQGLMWTAHARIKGSRGFPEAYWNAPFYRSDRFLGAAWKAMPADYSQPRLGQRVFDLLDDMSNAGLKKYTPAEADLFRMEPDYESYGHLAINYLQIDAVPRFADGWQPVLDALRAGRFFASTGEVLIPEFRVNGKRSGEMVTGAVAGSTLTATLEWTFPLAFAEIISGDGQKTFRERIDLSGSEAFGDKKLVVPVDLSGRRWIRLEVWDMARNGAFTQPIWIE